MANATSKCATSYLTIVKALTTIDNKLEQPSSAIHRAAIIVKTYKYKCSCITVAQIKSRSNTSGTCVYN